MWDIRKKYLHRAAILFLERNFTHKPRVFGLGTGRTISSLNKSRILLPDQVNGVRRPCEIEDSRTYKAMTPRDSAKVWRSVRRQEKHGERFLDPQVWRSLRALIVFGHAGVLVRVYLQA